MSLRAQAKLLRALQEHEIERVGGTRSIRVDVRIVAATNIDLWDEVQQHRFRRDLYYRLNVFPIDLPPLRSRRNDSPLLIDHFTAHYARLHGKRVKGLTSSALETLLNYEYPGNVRELQNLIERGVISAADNHLIDRSYIFRQGETLARQTFVPGSAGRLQSSQDHTTLEQIEQDLCRTTLEKCEGNIALAARRLGMTRPTLEYRLRKWGVIQRKKPSVSPHT